MTLTNVLYYLTVGIYTLTLVYITLFCLMQLHLLWQYRKKKDVPPVVPPPPREWPMVTIQLPIYNELFVAERLIDNIARLDYPRDRLEIQVLDDSTDETVDIVARKVEAYRRQGLQIHHIRRGSREGYKAGALEYGLGLARGEFIAIFDADFLPRPDFLKRTIPWFDDPRIGVVQTRWEHINEDYSLITRLQALQLNVHFSVEQTGRRLGNYLLQFNGTAGVWRRRAIEDAGGWQPDTLTEDLDLSIRAQLRGWKIHYLEEVGAPAELPAEMNSLKSQQYRWMKGGAETAKKMLPRVWRSNLSLTQKLHATGHLLASSIFVFVFIAGVFSVPMLFAIDALGLEPKWYTFFLTGWLSIIAVYYVGNVQTEFLKGPYLKRVLKFVLLFPLFLALSMGLSLHNTVAVLQGYLGKKTPFVRTPKFDIRSVGDSLRQRARYLQGRLSWLTVFEGLLAVYFLVALVEGIRTHQTWFAFFHFLLLLGYGAIFFLTVRHLKYKG